MKVIDMTQTASAHDIQREADAAFFEDWSEWANLGGWPSHHSYPVGKRPNNMPHYHCTLREHSNFMGGPAFEISTPENIITDRMLRSIPGARLYPRPYTRRWPVDVWFVPVAQWRPLRAALPQIAAIIDRIVRR